MNAGLELERVYTRWIALELVRRGFKIVKWDKNEYHPQYDTYYFVRTPEFISAFRSLTKRGHK